MGDPDILDDHEKSETWKQIWFLTQKHATTGKYIYYQGLSPDEREELLAFLYDILDYERTVVNGDRVGTIDTSPSERGPDDALADDWEKDVAGIYSPSLYSFGEGKVWIPWAEDATSGAKRGRYAQGYPRGLVVHWTAGHRNGLEAGNELMRSTGMLYLLADEDGKIAQSDSLAFHGYHAGKSSHKYANGYVSDEYAGVEIQAAGMLTRKGSRWVSWFGGTITDGEVLQSPRRENIAPGAYHAYTDAQMIALRKLIAWLYLNNPTVFSIDRVVGHDEVSPGRKVDPGASTHEGGKVITMSELRAICWNDVDRITEARKKAA